MRREFDITSAKFVTTKDELNFSEVLDDFNSAEFIYIVTYNISRWNETLLEKLKKVSDKTEIKIFTNIPNRFDTYYKGAADKAKTNIDNYTSKLDPQKFNDLFSSFFFFNNHAKIIMTNRMAYLGSSNFSSESANNLETGIITDDKQLILKIKHMIDIDIQPLAEPYYAYDIFPLIQLIKEMEQFRVFFSENVWGVWDSCVAIDTGYYYKGSDIVLDLSLLESFEGLKTMIEETLTTTIEDIRSKSEDDTIELIIDKLSDVIDMVDNYTLEEEVVEFLKFDEMSYIDELMQENAIWLTEDVLHENVNNFTQQAFEIKDRFADEAHQGFIDLEYFINSVIKSLSEGIQELKGREDINPSIDNT